MLENYDNQKYWSVTGALLPGDSLDFLRIPFTVPRNTLYHSDAIIAYPDNGTPIYIKRRAGPLNDPIDPNEMVYIQLSSQLIET